MTGVDPNRPERSQVTDEQQVTRTRPKLVWAIIIFYVVSFIYTAFSFYAVYSGLVPLNEAQQAYFDSMSAFDHIASVVLVAASLSGAILLFQLKRLAFHFFVGAFGAGLLMTMWHAFSKGWFAVLVEGGFAGTVIGWAIQISICTYCWILIRRGILS